MVLLLFLHRILITLQNYFLFFALNVAHILQKNFPILHSIHESRTLNLIYWEAYQGGNERYCVSKNVFQLFFPYATLFSYITNPENIQQVKNIPTPAIQIEKSRGARNILNISMGYEILLAFENSAPVTGIENEQSLTKFEMVGKMPLGIFYLL